MKIGSGRKKDGAALLTAGVDRIFWHPDDTYVFTNNAGAALRKNDTLTMADPTVLKPAEFEIVRDACKGPVLFQVIGHDPVELPNTSAIRAFRKLKPRDKNTVIKEPTGRPRDLKYTVEQADAIIRLWHDIPKRKPSDIVTVVDSILGVPTGTTKAHWVRDLVKKYTGTAQLEKPAGWRGVRID